jgi:hypothetical protein
VWNGRVQVGGVFPVSSVGFSSVSLVGFRGSRIAIYRERGWICYVCK